MNYYMSEMIRLGADGVDFIEIGELLKCSQPPYNVLLSVSKDDFNKLSSIPKTGYKFWKFKNGHKEYL